MELTPLDRLKLHLKLHHPNVQLNHVRLSPQAGFLTAGGELMDLRGIGYPSRINGKKVSILRLWSELHEHFATAPVQIVKRKHGQATSIAWNGCTYRLDHHSTYKSTKGEKHGLHSHSHQGSRPGIKSRSQRSGERGNGGTAARVSEQPVTNATTPALEHPRKAQTREAPQMEHQQGNSQHRKRPGTQTGPGSRTQAN